MDSAPTYELNLICYQVLPPNADTSFVCRHQTYGLILICYKFSTETGINHYLIRDSAQKYGVVPICCLPRFPLPPPSLPRSYLTGVIWAALRKSWQETSFSRNASHAAIHRHRKGQKACRIVRIFFGPLWKSLDSTKPSISG